MRYLFGFMCVLALGLMGCSETTGTGGSGGTAGMGGDGGTGGNGGSGGTNSFEIARDEEELSYDWTRIALSEVAEDEPQQVLSATNTRDPLPDFADDEHWDNLRIEFDRDVLLIGLALDQDHPISGEGSWSTASGDTVTWLDVTFVGTELHTPAIEHIFFAREWFGCGTVGGADPGAQTMGGTLRLAASTMTRLAGVIEVRVEGDVPCTDNDHQYFDLTLKFDLGPGESWTDQVDDTFRVYVGKIFRTRGYVY